MSQPNKIAYLEDESIKIARGQVKGVRHVHRAGFNPGLQNGVEEMIWGNASPEQYYGTSANTISVVSSSSADTNIQLRISGLDNNWDEIDEVITLNGTTPVLTTKQYIRINETVTVGSIASVGTITFKDGSNDVAYIAAGYNRGLKGAYSVPRNYTAYLLKGSTSTAKGGDATVKMQVRTYGSVWLVGHIAQSYQSQYVYEFPIPLEIPEKSDIKVTAVSSSTGTSVSCNFDLILVRNPNT